MQAVERTDQVGRQDPWETRPREPQTLSILNLSNTRSIENCNEASTRCCWLGNRSHLLSELGKSTRTFRWPPSAKIKDCQISAGLKLTPVRGNALLDLKILQWLLSQK